MPWNREDDEEYDDGYTRESFERAEEGGPEDYSDESPIDAGTLAADCAAADWWAHRTRGPDRA